MSDKKTITLIIRKRERVLFEGEVNAFTSFNEKGTFDVLQEHANFISLIKETCVIHKTDGTKNEIKIEQGIVSVMDDKASVYLGIMG